MTVALWILNILLAVAFLGAGGMKTSRSRAQLKEAGMGWTDAFSDAGVRLIGIAEVLGAVGLILPLALDIAPILTPLASVGLAITMGGATVVHARRKEPIAITIALTVLTIASAVLGFVVVGS